MHFSIKPQSCQGCRGTGSSSYVITAATHAVPV